MTVSVRASLALVAIFALFAADASGQEHSLATAQEQYRANRVTRAERAFSRVVSDSLAAPEERAEAARELARIAWLVHGDASRAHRLIAAMPTSHDRCLAAVLVSRIEREAGAFGPGLTDAASTLHQCAGGDADALQLNLARAWLAQAEHTPLRREELLAEALATLNAVGELNQRQLQACATRLGIGVMQRDSAVALAGWRCYFWLADTDAPQALAAFAGRVESLFVEGLGVDASIEHAVTLSELFIRSGFADIARSYAADQRLAERARDQPAWRRLAAYLAFHQTVSDLTLRANRAMATRRRARTYERDVIAAMQTLMRDAGLSGDPRVALREAYGLYGTIGETSGYPSLHAGHLTQNEAFTVEQYGRRGELRFTVVDNMLANGFESWLWDGWAQTGGWSPDAATIVQVRSAYADGPLNALALARPGVARDRALERMNRNSAAERAALENTDIANLPAVSTRLQLQTIDSIYTGVNGDQDAFLAEHWRAVVQHSITIHEGRHALDRAAAPDLESEELEFRAKLSELALADYPRLALANLVDGAVGANTGHGQANARILRLFANWMAANTAQINGFDANTPALMQLDKLTNEQIRAVARAADPFA